MYGEITYSFPNFSVLESLKMDNLFHPTLHRAWACDYLSTLPLMFIHVCKRSPDVTLIVHNQCFAMLWWQSEDAVTLLHIYFECLFMNFLAFLFFKKHAHLPRRMVLLSNNWCEPNNMPFLQSQMTNMYVNMFHITCKLIIPHFLVYFY